jgi:hypothetical protein
MRVWAYIHPELNILCCALIREAIPKGVSAIEFEVDSPDDVVYDGVQIRVKTLGEKLQELKTQKLSELKSYVGNLLAPTDYVVIKINEAQAQGDFDTVDMLKQKYDKQLQRRQKIRQWNAQLEQSIENATKLEELKMLEIVFIEEI